jgi:hypothetical protein
MRSALCTRWTALLGLNVLAICVLGFYERSAAQLPPGTNAPFVDAVEQRVEMINHLKELVALAKEQNALLRSGKLQVVVAVEQKKR